jgi:UPF0755 protein
LRRLLRASLVAAFFIIAGLAAAGIWLRSELETPYYPNQKPEVFVEIPRGANTTEAADLLVHSGALRTRLPFLLYLRFANPGRHIQAGEYRFSQAATPIQVAQRLMRGDVYFRAITIPEGLTARETIELLAKNGLGNLAGMEHALLKSDWIRDIDPAARNLEGYLFPETYHFKRKTDSETIVKAMVDQFRIKLAKALKANPLSAGWKISQIVILASMIEKEVKKSEEGPLVASVLINRLERRMPLGCDATIIYAMKLAGTYEGRLSKADMGMPSPYNSYLHPNLPPGPICNPGVNSIRAALNPARTDYLYYVSRNDGTHQFSKDFSSHLRAVDRFQKSPLSRGFRN